ncbi:MAG: recombinase family protein [Intestinibacter sp.]|uniref:recombinase family protein n=1 Tax=Intestinibacter sp. TaxID=1965304 RepID=UPI003F161444
MKTCIYLRKSRADEELEKRENVDTLSRHRSTLLEVARKQNLDIVEIKEEIVSGDSIAKRPKMTQLLDEVKNKQYDAVLCMDIDRLGRGDMQDQGLIINTFKESNTFIITPDKTYNLNNDLDEEMTEFKTFFARRELKVITKRMQRGRVKSIKEGKFIGSIAPLGYRFEYDDKTGKRSMLIDEETAPIIKTIFEMYLEGNGSYKIMNYLNSIGATTSYDMPFTECAVRRIIHNKTYCGYVTWFENKRKGTKTRKNKDTDVLICKGQHEPIISEEDWNKAQTIIKANQIAANKANYPLINPLAGIVKCGVCNRTMQMTSSISKKIGKTLYLRCNICYKVGSIKFKLLEEEIIKSLELKLEEIKSKLESTEVEENTNNSKLNTLKNTLNLLQKEEKELAKQKNNLHDLLERGIYDVDTYLERSAVLAKKSEDLTNSIKNTKLLIKNENEINIDYEKFSNNLENALFTYKNTDNIELKNKAIKSVISEVIYYKEKKRNSEFHIEIKFKI